MRHDLISDSIFHLNDITTFQAHLADIFIAHWDCTGDPSELHLQG